MPSFALRDTRTTREVEDSRNMLNRKPYRTAEQKEEARRLAEKRDGRWGSTAPVSFHTKRKGQQQ